MEPDFRLETLSQDLLFVINETKTRMRWEKLPDIILVGHSLGGAVVTDVARKGELGAKLLAYAVLDVVEGMSPTHFLLRRRVTKQDPRWTPSKAWINTSPPAQRDFLLWHPG